jgi:hypothetical protein
MDGFSPASADPIAAWAAHVNDTSHGQMVAAMSGEGITVTITAEDGFEVAS